MKQLRVLLAAVALLLSLGLTSCNQDNPAEADLFVGTYKGKVSFIKVGEDAKNISNDNGSVFVAKVGDSYTFRFSDGIPTLANIKMEKNDDTLVSIGTDGLAIIKITGDHLTISYTTKEGSWNADAKRK